MFRIFENCVDPFAVRTPAAPSPRIFTFLREALSPLYGVMALSTLLTALGVSIELWLVWYAGHLVDALSTTPRDQVLQTFGTEFALAAIALLVVRPLNAFISESLDDIAFRPNAVSLIRWHANAHVLSQPVSWFQHQQSGMLANRVRELGNAATGIVYSFTHTLSYVIFYMIGSIWLMASVDLRLGIPLAIWLALYLGLMVFSVPRFGHHTEKFQNALTRLTGHLVDTYANIQTIKLFASRSAADQERTDTFKTARTAFIGVQRFEVTINSGMVLLANVLLVGLVGYAIHLWIIGDAPLGLIAAALALSIRISAMAEWMLDAVAYLFGQIGATRDALSAIAQPVAIADAPDARPLAVSGGGISIRNVSHRYGIGTGGVRDVSLEIPAGQKLGLVGPSGAGKSTLVNLLLRFHEAEQGEIAIDGQPIRTVTQQSLWSSISMVAQDPALLHRSIRDNIAYGRPDMTDAEIMAAAGKAEAGFIAGLRDHDGRTGLDAHVGERGVRLSGGQRQRIAIARAILKQAPILILDEATSALDSEVETVIQAALDELMQHRTVIAIAHRLSTLARMDRIVVLDDGRLVEDGTHADLLAANGLYARLWAHQSGGFIGRQTQGSANPDH